MSFEDIRIIGLDDKKTHNPNPSTALYNMYLELSNTPPLEWKEIFEEERRFPRHSMWRRAWIEDKYIIVHCIPEELGKYHLRDLKQDVNNTNSKYREYSISGDLVIDIKQWQELKERERIEEVKRQLKF